MRARAEVFERNIYSAAPHAAQRRRHARGAVRGRYRSQGQEIGVQRLLHDSGRQEVGA